MKGIDSCLRILFDQFFSSNFEYINCLCSYANQRIAKCFIRNKLPAHTSHTSNITLTAPAGNF